MSKTGSRLSLRARLLIIALATLIVGTLAIDFTTVTALRSFLVARVDSQLTTDIPLAARELLHSSVYGNSSFSGLVSLPQGSYGELIFSNGTSIVGQFSNSVSEPPPNVATGKAGDQRVDIPVGHPITIELPKTSYAYRVLAARDPSLGATMILSIPLTSVESTLQRLELAEFFVSLGVVLALGLAGAFSIRIGLKPLERMRAQARDITAGDSMARVDDEGPQEIASLAGTLNTMLERLQEAYNNSQSSQTRLRQFIADVSHELRTPLTSIKGYAELYLDGALDPTTDTPLAMERIQSEASRMAALIEDLLLLARMDENRPLSLAPIDLSALARAAVMDATAVEPERKIDLITPAEALVLGDQHRLTQVITNLLSNVRTHTPATATVTVRIEILPKDAKPPTGAHTARGISDLFGSTDETIALLEWDAIVRLTVCDSGPGLDSQQLERVFERFYRSDESRSRARGGAGLGLSLVAAITHAHGGNAWVTSAGLGRGSCFGIDLPMLEMDTGDVNPAPSVPALVTESTGRFAVPWRMPSRRERHAKPE
ncbi:sensor histidine kinase [Ferrimicrobium acidiphilum]|uniref:histidine kinase n=1 Tax=Ferrimicrobium acidiphilum DSM 19497 TaxID=1121877 RepID=A0A0D8FYA4_9ACTN|nr:ATP-binding protein [Ferrimicrobium acidiphilum]KJE78146.1 putative sensor histidine kinase TcrY [Ferrimicrobium acidiphilum DSM 19497]MCL5053567.1 ATP-binding protein [Gammaproteobacteria bacterium]